MGRLIQIGLLSSSENNMPLAAQPPQEFGAKVCYCALRPARVRKVCGDKSQCINSRSCQASMLKYRSGNIPHPAKLFAECGLKSYLPTVQGDRWPGSGLMRSAADGRFQLFPY